MVAMLGDYWGGDEHGLWSGQFCGEVRTAIWVG